MTAIAEEKPTSRAVHAVIVLQRFALGALICAAMPFAHAVWGHAYLGDGQKSFGVVMAFLLIGACAAAAYFVVASVLHYVFRKKRWRFIVTLDGSIGVAIIVILILAGLTATYEKG